MLTSFIVPAFNEEHLLGTTLDAIDAAAQNCGERYEIIVADDDSSDHTGSVAKAHGADVICVKHRQN